MTLIVWATELASLLEEHPHEPRIKTLINVLARSQWMPEPRERRGGGGGGGGGGRKRKAFSLPPPPPPAPPPPPPPPSSLKSSTLELGKQAEAKVVHAYGLQKSNEQTFSSMITSNILLVGKVDGFDAKTGALIEIKFRTRPFPVFHYIAPWYNVIQCFCYMHLTGARRICLKEVDPVGKEKNRWFAWDLKLWDKWMVRLTDLVERLTVVWFTPGLFEMFQYNALIESWDICELLLEIAE